MSQNDRLADLFLGIFFGFGLGFCLLGLALAILWGIFPDYGPISGVSGVVELQRRMVRMLSHHFGCTLKYAFAVVRSDGHRY